MCKVKIFKRNSSIVNSGHDRKRYKSYIALLLSTICLITPVIITMVDPIPILVNYFLRLKPGSYLYNALQKEFKGAKLYLHPFNISNADRFISGEDRKLKLNEIGPFVYQEYRWYEDLEASEDGREMTMTSRIRSEFLPEESMGRPEDINITVANLPLLSLTSMASPYPSFVRLIANNMITMTKSKIITNIDLYNYFWGFKDPLLVLFNKILPSSIYYDSLGILERLYDDEADYKILVGTTDQDRLKIKRVKKFLHLGTTDQVQESSELTFATDTYEAIGYPPELTPEVPIALYRAPFCRTAQLEYKGRKTMEYGGEGLVYTLSNITFINETSPITKLMYPIGLMDMSACFFGAPFVITKSHFLDADPKLLESIEGLTPDKERFVNEMVIDRRAAITYNTRLSLQLNFMVHDVSYNWEARRFSNTLLPIVRVEMVQPKMPEDKMKLFYLAYQTLPRVLIAIQAILTIVGLFLFMYSIRSIYMNSSVRERKLDIGNIREKTVLTATESDAPLTRNQEENLSS